MSRIAIVTTGLFGSGERDSSCEYAQHDAAERGASVLTLPCKRPPTAAHDGLAATSGWIGHDDHERQCAVPIETSSIY